MNKLALRIILAAAVSVSTVLAAGAQEQKLKMPDTRMSVSSIFRQIRHQTHLGVAYRTDQIDPARVVTLPAPELTLAHVIELVTEGSAVEGIIDGYVIVFVKKKTAPGPAVPAPDDGFVPTPLAEFRESLGLRPKKVVLEGDEKEARRLIVEARREEVEIDMPMEVHLLPTAGYGLNMGRTPRFALKTNLLYGLGTLTPNFSAEFGLGAKTSLELGGSYHPWRLKGSLESNKKLVHMFLKPELRYWLCERFDGHFFGAHLLYARYNVGTWKVPGMFEKQYRYDGHGAGLGLTYGYNLSLHKRWGLEFAVGVGAMKMWGDRYDCAACNRESQPTDKWYFGPTNAAVSLVFLIK